MNPFNYVVADLQLTVHSQGEWSWLHAWLVAMAPSFDDDAVYSNHYREVIRRLPIEGYFQERVRQLLNPGMVKDDARGVAH